MRHTHKKIKAKLAVFIDLWIYVFFLKDFCPTIEIYCPHQQHGCVFTCKRNEMQDHLQVCAYEQIKNFFPKVHAKIEHVHVIYPLSHTPFRFLFFHISSLINFIVIEKKIKCLYCSKLFMTLNTQTSSLIKRSCKCRHKCLKQSRIWEGVYWNLQQKNEKNPENHKKNK